MGIKEEVVMGLGFNAFNEGGSKRLEADDVWEMFGPNYFRGVREMKGILSEEDRFDRVLVFCYRKFEELDRFLNEMILQCLDVGSRVYQPGEDIKLVILEPLREGGFNRIRKVIARVLREGRYRGLKFFILQSKYRDETEVVRVLSLILTSRGFSLLPIKDRRIFLYHEIELLYQKYRELSNLIRSSNFSLSNLVFHLQPILNSSGNVNGYEVLSRIRGNDGVLYYPGRFYWVFGIDSSLFYYFEEAVIEKFRRFLEKISRGDSSFFGEIGKKDLYMEGLEFHVNFSPFFVIEHFAEVEDVLFLARQTRRRLCVELIETDSEVSKNIDYYEPELNRVSNKIKENGGLFILDDFGTGHSNFDLLRRVHFDGIKVSIDFIMDTVRNKDRINSEFSDFMVGVDDSIQGAVSYLCRSIAKHRRVYFEKVENYEQYRLVKENICFSERCFFQGFALGKMLTVDEANSVWEEY